MPAWGLHLCGFRVAATGVLREIGRDAKRIAAKIENAAPEQINIKPTTPMTTNTVEHNADVIREMIRHEENLILSRANWLVTLQAILVTGLAFSWERRAPRLSYTFIISGVISALMFMPHLYYGNRAIKDLLEWWGKNRGDYRGPRIIGLEERPWLLQLLLSWMALPILLFVAWVVLALVTCSGVNS